MQLQFTPYNLRYPELQTHFQVCRYLRVRIHTSTLIVLQESGLNELVNNWNEVDDFNWLVPATPSPNWTILPSEERKIWD